ncbi:C21orf2 isoform X2 [Brachionus plicatilis]|uniref:C21orf2 isoform X2 n=1 Tax=Brachionus plicatilis TaxID=10195 RepID=A0A3M7RT51_BRAPC|nr:C21orf2 isoform X2 [Brachionus plicatilis]
MDSLTVDIALQGNKSKNLETVKKLNLWASDFNDVSLVKEMPNLEILILSANKISSLKDIQYCESLRELYLRNNKIKRLNEIFYLKGLKNLKILWLDENPCTESENYRLNVLKNLSCLEYLDNTIVTEEEVQQAIEVGEDFNYPPDSIELDKLILPLKSDELANGDNSVIDDSKSIDETEKNNLASNFDLDNDDYSQIDSTQDEISKEKIENDNVLSAILILLENLNFNQLDQVIHQCKKLKNS